MYSFHGSAYETSFPMIWVLATNRDTVMYKQILTVIINAIEVSFFLIYPLDGQKTKKTKTKSADFFVNTGILDKLFQKEPKF